MAKSLKDIRVVAPAKAGGGKQATKQGRGSSKASAKGQPARPALWDKLATLPRRTLIGSGAAAVLVVLIMTFLFSGPTRKVNPAQTPPTAPAPAADLAAKPGGFSERPLEQPPPPPKVLTPEEEGRPVIKSLRLLPPQPTSADQIKAEIVTAANGDPSRITYTYVWKVNNRTIADAKGDTLINLAAFKKRDLVSLTVTPYDGDKAGFPVDSPLTAIHGVPPSLDLQAPPNTNKFGKAADMQLVSSHPDSEGISFSLEAPLIPGMSIDSQTGKITWTIPPNQKGTIRFGAAVEDSDKTKVTKIFDITLE